MKDPTAPRPDFVRRLRREIETWRADGALDPASAERLLARYPEPPPTDWRGRVVTALSVIAASLLGMGVIMFFAANWDRLGPAVKLGIVMVLLASAYVSGWWLKYKKDFPRVGASVILLGAILFGAAIFLVAQAFNLREHYPNGLLLWSLGILPLALIESSAPILVLFTAVFCAWSGTETIEFHNFGVVPLLVILGVVFPLAYRLKSRIAVGGALAALAWFLVEGVIHDTPHHSDPAAIVIITLVAAFGAALWVVGEAHRRIEGYERYSFLFQFPGLVIVLGILYALSFPGIIHELGHEHHDFGSIAFTGPAIGALAFAAIAGGFILPGLLREGAHSRPELYAGAGVVALVTALNLGGVTNAGANETAGSLLGFIYNVVFIGLLVGMIVVGHRHERRLLVNFGMAGIAVVLATRYIDWFWDMLPRSLFFIIGGVVFLAGGMFLERQRRRLLPPAREERK